MSNFSVFSLLRAPSSSSSFLYITNLQIFPGTAKLKKKKTKEVQNKALIVLQLIWVCGPIFTLLIGSLGVADCQAVFDHLFQLFCCE